MAIGTSARKYLPAPVTDLFRSARYNLDRWTFPRHVVQHRYGPYYLQMNIRDRVAKEWYDKDWEPLPEIDFLAHFGLDRGARVFDLGAHQCLIAIMLAKTVGPLGQVIAVEANPHNAAVGRDNVALNQVPNVEVVHSLISSAVGQEFAIPAFNSSRAAITRGGAGGTLVEALTIDALAQRHGSPDVIYMDIEGFEIEALKGASDTLSRRCTWFIELHGDDMLSRYKASNRDILPFFPEEAYATYVGGADDTRFHPLVDRRWLPRERCYLIFVPTPAPGSLDT